MAGEILPVPAGRLQGEGAVLPARLSGCARHGYTADAQVCQYGLDSHVSCGTRLRVGQDDKVDDKLRRIIQDVEHPGSPAGQEGRQCGVGCGQTSHQVATFYLLPLLPPPTYYTSYTSYTSYLLPPTSYLLPQCTEVGRFKTGMPV